MSNPKVLVIGCGVAGPVIALLLKRKGYQPIVLEKVRELGDAGASLMLFPNGLKVLSLLGLASFVTSSAPHLKAFCDRAYSGKNLGLSSLPSSFEEKYGFPGCGVKRTALNLALKEALLTENIEVHEGWKLEKIIENEFSVTAISEQGQKVEGEFLIGCDGIKAVSRSLILEKHGIVKSDETYTGLTQTAGMSPTPSSLLDSPVMLNIYGPGAHVICYPVSPTTTSWAITQRESGETKETWRAFSGPEKIQQQTQLLERFKGWCNPIQELIEGSERIIKYGLYDRPQLKPSEWFSPQGRCVLIGDAAHPTSPHLGQGANQALEDCYHLDRLIPSFKDGTQHLSYERLNQVFSAFAELRQPRTAALVEGARAQGESRVIDGGLGACAERDERLSRGWKDKIAVEAKYHALFKEPY